MLDRVLGAFDRWLAGRESDQQRRNEVTEIARTACELKSSYLGESNPADWSPKTAVEVLGQVFPRKVVGVEDSYIGALVPAMLTYVEFLVVTGRWKPHNDVSATRSALSTLEDDLAGRFNDPARLSMAGRLMQLAVDDGVDITEQGALEGFMHRFNNMPYEYRKRVTDSPGMPPSLTDDLGFGHEAFGHEVFGDEDGATGVFDGPDVLEDLTAAIATGIASIDFVPGDTVPLTVPDARLELTALLSTPLLTRMSALVEWVRPGRKITSTGAIRRSDTADWVRRFGIVAAADSPPNSMWDWPELAAPWSIAGAGGMIDISTTKARPGPNSDVFDTADLPTQILCAREAVDLLLEGLVDSGDEPSELDQAVAALLLPVLAVMCRPEGVDLSQLRSLARAAPDEKGADYSQAVTRILLSLVLNIIAMLEGWGLLVVADGRTSIPPALRPALVQAIKPPDALFSIVLDPGAVPLVK